MGKWKNHFRYIDPETLKQKTRTEEFLPPKYKKMPFKKIIEGRLRHALPGHEWGDHPMTSNHTKESTYIIHTIDSDLFLKPADALAAVTKPDAEICCTLTNRQATQTLLRPSYRPFGFIVIPEWITRTFISDIGSSTGNVFQDDPLKSTGKRFTPEQLIDSEERPSEQQEFFGYKKEDFLSESLKRFQQLTNGINENFCKAFHDYFSNLYQQTIDYKKIADREKLQDFKWDLSFFTEEFLEWIKKQNLCIQYANIHTLLETFISEYGNEFNNLSLIITPERLNEFIQIAHSGRRDEFTDIPSVAQKQLLYDPKSHDYTELFAINLAPCGILIDNISSLKQYSLSITQLRKMYPDFPLLILDTWTLIPSYTDEQISIAEAMLKTSKARNEK